MGSRRANRRTTSSSRANSSSPGEMPIQRPESMPSPPSKHGLGPGAGNRACPCDPGPKPLPGFAKPVRGGQSSEPGCGLRRIARHGGLRSHRSLRAGPHSTDHLRPRRSRSRARQRGEGGKVPWRSLWPPWPEQPVGSGQNVPPPFLTRRAIFHADHGPRTVFACSAT